MAEIKEKDKELEEEILEIEEQVKTEPEPEPVVETVEVEEEVDEPVIETKTEPEKTNAEQLSQEFKDKYDAIWQRQVELELKLAGLEEFAEFLDTDEQDIEVLQNKIKKFQSILGKRELSTGYIPPDHQSADRYSLAEKNKDSKGMIATKLGKFFK